ncbi:MAG: oligosaccharide flippase family protein, partial [Anaerolineae bacterium]|nr:oligosaccharide flippase family protein [Anaerolineae bacterium]
AGDVKRAALMVHAVFAGIVWAVTFFGADLIARLLHDAALASYIRIAAFIPLLYAFYAVMVGVLNGLKRFAAQAALDMTFSTLKMGLIIALVLSGYAVAGAFSGFVLAAAIIMLLSAWTTRRVSVTADSAGRTRRLLAFMIPISLYTLCYNLLLNQDLLLIKSLQYGTLKTHFDSALGQLTLRLHYGAIGLDPAWLRAIGHGALSHDAATMGTSILAGYFGAMKTISNLPYQAVIAVTFVVFPLISQSSFRNDTAQTQRYVRNTFRFSYLVIMLLLSTLLPTGESLMAMVYGADYRVGGQALKILLLGTVLFSLFVVCTTIITSAGLPKTTLVLGALTALLNGGLCYWLITHGEPGVAALTRAAWADLIAIGLGAVAGFVVIYRGLGASPPWWSLLRITL